MKEHPNILRSTIIGTVVGSLLVSLVLWLVGFLPAVCRWLIRIIAGIWSWLGSSVGVPGWLVIAAVLLMAGTFIRFYQYFRSKEHRGQNTVENDTYEASQLEEALNELETKILHVISQADGERMTVDDISQRSGESHIRAQHALDTLNEKGLLELSYNYIDGTGYFLNRNGRQLVIELGMA
jgi:DNA-binding transcriptional ArsR family regulator